MVPSESNSILSDNDFEKIEQSKANVGLRRSIRRKGKTYKINSFK